MEHKEFADTDDLGFGPPKDESYRTCAECGGDCYPDPSPSADGIGVRIAYICPEHGMHSLIDPFEDKRKS